jgi:hypothetical protein
LTRSWFYRIFLVLAVLFICLFNIVALVSDDGNMWLMKAISSNIPYVNLLFLNTGQAVIAVFLSSEFLKTDKKLDTSEVFYVHPLSNAEYVIGKIWGNLNVFLRLDLLIIALVVIFNLVSGVHVDVGAYITYFLLICIPTLIYIFGLSVGMMLILKNQAITFVLLLGYIGLTLFYIGDKFYYLFDYMVYSLPLVKSSVVGFTHLDVLINHRLIYLLLGLGFICLAIFLFRRLPNDKYGRYRWFVIGLCFLISGLVASYRHIDSILIQGKKRSLYTEINNKYVHSPKMIVENYDITLEQTLDGIRSEAKINAVALENSPQFTFCLNPSLLITEITENGKELKYQRDNQIINIDFGRELRQGDSAAFSIKYEGYIDDGFCYLDIPKEILQESYSSEVFNIGKKYSFHTSDYILFTPETYWYPRPGSAYSSTSPDWQQAFFSNFKLTVKTLNNLKALSQGTSEMDSVNNVYICKTDFPSPSITLLIGDYTQKSIEIDSTLFSVWYLKGHDNFSSVFDSIIDTIPSQIRNARAALENQYSLDYSFKRFSVVEVPVQFFTYVRTWSQAQDKMQPEMVLLPERGCLFNDMNFAKRVKDEKKWGKQNGQELTDYEARMRAFNSFLWTFRRTESNVNWSENRGSVNVTAQSNPYFVFPQFFNFRYNIFSSEWSIANRLIELYIQNKQDNNTWMRQMNGLSNNEKANMLMEKYSFKELLSNVEHRGLLDNVITLKANYLFASGEENIGYQEFRDSLRGVLQKYVFTNINFEHLLDTMGHIANANLRSPIEAWNYPTPLPVYIANPPVVTQIDNRDGEYFVVKFQITNDSDNNGIVNLRTVIGGGGGMNNLYDPTAMRKVSLNAHETKQFVSIWDEAPRSIEINTLISANLPNIINLSVNNIIRERNRTLDQEGDFVIANPVFTLPGEIIVDNEDALLFSLSKPDIVGILPQWLDRVDDSSFVYHGISEWRPPLQWTLTTNDRYYGTHVRSAYVIKSGSGSQTATWKIPIPAAGRYDLFYYTFRENQRFRFGGGGGRGGGGGGGGGRGGGGRGRGEDAEYNFKVKYDGDEEKAYLNTRNIEEGWNLLGTYFFNGDTIEVALSNEFKSRMVTADAVKAVRRDYFSSENEATEATD